ncbi:hypothetical protein M501DRAFT_1014708 [Patellaria atrata CBS 101060]|uniref:Uncharacterized protein n=1 Tax=Patellaria atrata CBS 101060 TaxID=1346257 RepID=A0A9P4SDR7_9PEZI|nr:hypothetical protein M501DRAFT_1014708 [Patellaria atrata CBS 101060]
MRHTTTRTHHATPVRTTAARKPSLLSRLRGRRTATRRSTRVTPTTTTTTTVTQTTKTTRGHGTGVNGGARQGHRRKRHASLGDKVSGLVLRVKGSLTGRRGVKAAGTRRMHGTDGRVGRGTRRRY